ncbi:hypothetical protein NDU88_002824 [Pleurodeles waltl]|uniref:Uncharacterized protein n=1 Tax=Pleurodeles waltl TaxID=8319 RepID=A0AAV7TM71_PLEWA|nr:hypothetical protein NDU88_002824 [Pleurodeles waltl]
MSSRADDPDGSTPDTAMDRIHQEIPAVGHRLDDIDSDICALMAETISVCMDSARFQNHVTDLEYRISVAENHLNTLLERDQELLFLQSKVINLEDRSCRDNAHFVDLPEHAEGSDIKGFLKPILPALIGLTFEIPLELQRMHCIGLLRQYGSSHSRPIIACFLLYDQVRQLLTVTSSHGSDHLEGYEICIAAGFSRKTNECHKTFLSLWPDSTKLEVKYSLFEPVWMSITKDCKSKNVFDPEDLRLFLYSPAQVRASPTPKTLLMTL